MAKLTSTDWAEKWARRTQNASADYVKGVNAVTEAPGVAAARKVNKFRAGIEEAISSGKWEQNVAAVSIQDWKNAATTKGRDRFGAGAVAAQSKVQMFANEFGPFLDAARQRVRAMDDSTREGRKARMNAMVDEIAKFRFSKR